MKLPGHRGESVSIGARLAAAAFVMALLLLPRVGEASCAAPANAIEAENCLPGAPQSQWDLPGGTIDTSIEGFATDISVNRGETIAFKVRTSVSSWRIDVYRLGWYQGNGARLVTTISRSAAAPQPACLSDSATGLVDCGNWAVSATWAVPATATSGLYVARLVRNDTGGASHVVFVVRDDASTTDILFQSSDTTWQAYNDWGGRNLYGCGNFNLACRAFKVSYNRPFRTRQTLGESENWLFNAEYPLIRWLERNGYDVSYSTATDSDRRGALIRNHGVLVSNGHDEYWSAAQRANVAAARDAGVNLAFFSSNKIFWKIRWEPSVDGAATGYRTLVCYKETHANAKIDPLPDVWTGTWRDPRFSPPADGGRPENELAGTIFRINGPINDTITVPAAEGRARFWRNTTVASLPAGTTATLAPGTIGTEVDVDWDNGFRPPGLFGLSANPMSVNSQYLLDHGSTYGSGSDVHRVTLYRHASGALVWAANTYQWAWGLDSNHDRSNLGSTTDARMQQATVNLFADMGVQPTTLQSGLVPAAPSTDLSAPISTIGSPLPGAVLPVGVPAAVTGTAGDLGGVVMAVEVSVDGGTTWHPASGRESWTYTFTPSGSGLLTILSRAVDDTGNLEIASTGVTVSVGDGGGGTSPCTTTECTLFGLSAVPGSADGGADSPVELGVRFRSDVAGFVKGVRFYKSTANTGTHVANLWSSTGVRLATATFTGETASGWQRVDFATPVPVTANTIYVASYHTTVGHYAADLFYFSGAVSSPPLTAPADGDGGRNGIYAYGSTSVFPTSTWNATNYWVDPIFTATPPASLTSIAVAPADPTIVVGTSQQLTATGTYSDGTTADLTTSATWASSSPSVATVGATGLASGVGIGTSTLSATQGGVTGSTTMTVVPAPLAVATASLPGGTQFVAYAATLAASGGVAPYTWSIAAGGLPPGIALNASTGALAGTPTSSGTFPFTAQVTDAQGQVAARALGITVAAAPPLAITTASLPGATQFVAYAATLAASGGVAPYTWSIAAGGLPPGITLNASTGALAGTPTSSGTFPFTARVTDSFGQITTRALEIAVAAAPPLAVTTASLPGATQLVSYSATLAASGGVAPYAWSIAAGQLPPGITLSASTGALTGTPTASGTYPFTVQVTDSFAQVATRALDITVAAPPPLAITTAALPDGTQGLAYAALLAATGGVSPYTWSNPAGLPPGLSVGASTGLVSGTPTATGVFSFSIQATDAVGAVATRTLSITVLAPAVFTLWPASTVPPVTDGGADRAVEVGVKFRSEQAGFISGVRFYKSPANTGTHVGSLWNAAGTLLASATFTNETASGWQQATFANPVPIQANVVYVASYHTSVGHYAFGLNYFTVGWDSPPLHAPSSGDAGGNGVYIYSASSRFPNRSYRSSNYWVDVVFSPSSAPAALVSIAIAPASPTVPAGGTLQLTATGTYSDGSQQNVTGSVTWSSSSPAVATVSATGLATGINPGTTTISAATGGVTGSTTLTVQAATPPPDEGPGGPILVVAHSVNPFSRYLAEILKAEGFNAYTVKDAATVTPEVLAAHDVVVLGEFPLTASQALMLVDWVSNGGRLVAMRPDKQLASLLGLVDAGATLSEGYLRVDTTSPPGAGIVGQTIQFHGTADRYALSGATAVATLYSSATQATTAPAVTIRNAGLGKAAAFTYDLARSVVHLRQGNPAWSGQERDGASPVRSDDLYYGAASFDPRADWVDLSRVAIPQADEQQRLFANLLLHLSDGRRPLPRFWYFPSGHKAVIVMTGDDHGNNGTAGRFDQQIAASAPGCSVADWECVRSTSYLYPSTPLSDAEARQYTLLGFEVGVHVTTGCRDWSSLAGLDADYVADLAAFTAAFPTVPPPSTHRTHCIVWSDYDSQPRVELSHGIRLDTNYYYWPPGWVNDRPGFMTGSGIPMRFVTRTGELVDVYQAATQMTDESGQTYPFTANALLDAALGPQGYYGAFTANMHTDAVNSTGANAIIGSAQARGVPVVSARQLLEWLDGRDGSSFSSISWSGGTLSFGVVVASGARNARAMLPASFEGMTLAEITEGGVPISFTLETIKGVSYAIFPVTTTSYQATYR